MILGFDLKSLVICVDHEGSISFSLDDSVTLEFLSSFGEAYVGIEV